MTTNNPETVEQASNSLWPVRAEFPVGATRRHRKQQYDDQMRVLMLVIVATVVVGAIVVLLNWREAGSTKAADCINYPQYCVPFAGGASLNPALEGTGVRDLEARSEGTTGVVRYVDTEDVPTLGDPAAPIHFRTVSNFACSHCNSFHTGDMETFIKDYVLTGQATLGSVMVTGMAQEYTSIATEGALCAGEQGAFWEMTNEIFRLARTEGYQMGFSIDSLRRSADKMGLDKNALATCIEESRYAEVIYNYELFSADQGISGTPTVLVSYGDSGEWQTLANRSYDSLVQLTEAANQ